MKAYYETKKIRLTSLLITSLLVFIIMLLTMGLSIEQPIVISENVVDSIYSDNSFDYDDYIAYIDNKENKDINITKETLKSVKYLNIDANSLGNSSFFKYATNIEKLTIYNYQNLSKEDIKNLKSLKSLKTLYIDIDGNFVLKNPNYKIDLGIYPNLDTLYINCNLSEEIDSYISYNLIKDNKINNIEFFDDISIDELKAWDQKIDGIITLLKLSNLSDKEKINKIAKYIIDHLKYDQDVYNYLLSTTRKNYEYKIDSYNEGLISSILNNDNNIKDAICCNYAAFASILLYKVGIESYYLVGSVNNAGHAWNLVVLNNKNYFMDLTFLDGEYNINRVLISNNMSDYKIYSDYEMPSETTKIEPTYYNINATKLVIKWNKIF